MDKAMPLLRGEEGEVVGGQPGKKNRKKEPKEELGKKNRKEEPRKKSSGKEPERRTEKKSSERSIGKNKKSLKSKKETRDA